MSVNGISALERGANRAPQRATLALLIDALGLTAEQAESLTRAAARPALPRTGASRRRASEALPSGSAPFFGRQTELDAITHLLGSTALVTLTGPGGIGKTRLALRIAEHAAGTFGHGFRFVDLAPVRDPNLVGCTLAAQFEVKERDGEEISETIARELRSKHALVIIDNCEHLQGAAASVAETLLRNCPDVRIIATSRQSLNVPGEHIYRVRALDVAAAVELFADRTKRAGAYFAVTDDNYDAVARIVRRLDGIALAIELAAARMNVLTLPQLEARLSMRFHVLTGGSAVRQPRQQTMRAAVDWSYNLLDDEEQGLFRGLGVFSNGFSLDAALHVCEDRECDESNALEVLSRLVDKSLVVSDGVEGDHRFRLLETIRSYATEKADQCGETAMLRRRHAEYFASLAETADCNFGAADSKHEWILTLEPELDNFRVALQWSLGTDGDIASGVELVTNLQEFWIAQGFAKDMARRSAMTLAAHRELSEAQRGALWLVLARMRQELFAHPQVMLEAAAKARELCDRVGDRGGLALALRQYGTALMRLGEYPEAESKMRESIKLYRTLRDPRMVVRGLGNLAALLRVRGDYSQARTVLLDALQLARALGDDRIVPTTAMNLADTEFALGQVESAARRAKENLKDDIVQKSPELLACQESNLAAYLFALGRSDEALVSARASVSAASGSFVAVPLQHVAAIVAPADAKRAARLLGYVEATFESTGFSRQYTETYTYEALMRTLHEHLSNELLAEEMRAGASMNDEQAMHLAGARERST